MKVIITGVTGMVGEGVLLVCLNHKDISEVLVIGRKACGYSHPKLKEIVHADLYDLSPVAAQMKGYDACMFCLGTSSVGKSDDEFRKISYDLTMSFAKTLVSPNMTFMYVSGGGTDSTEKGRIAWARIKGKTENDLLKMPFKASYMFRPGFLKPIERAKNTNSYYKYITWIFPFLKLVFPNMVSTLQDFGLSMINAAKNGYEKSIIEVKDINELAK
jgi:uncharacterized protein YbjT (DUF2867 family)